MNFAQRTINNAIFNALSWIFPLGLSFLVLPYIVHRLGADVYGIFAVITSVVGYFALLDMGLGTAVIKYVAEYNGEGRPEKVNEVIGVTLLIFLIFGVVGGILILSISTFMVAKFLKMPPDLIGIAHGALCISAGGFFLNMMLSVLSVIPNGLNRYEITSVVKVITGSFTMIGTALLVYLGYGLLEIVGLNVLINLALIFLYAFFTRRLLPSVSFVPSFELSVMKKILKFGVFSLLSRISYLVNYQVDRLVVGAILGVSWVTYYVVPFTLLNRLSSITVSVGTVIFPAISELQGNKRYETITELYLISSRVIVAIAVSIIFPLLVFGDRLMSLWMGTDFGEKTSTVMFLLTVVFFLSALTNVPSFAADGLGKPKVTGIAAISNTVLYLALIIPMARNFGIEGVAAAILISSACVTPAFVWYVNNKLIGVSMLRLLKEAYARPFFAGLLVFVPLCFLPQDRINNVFVLVGIGISSSLVYFFISTLTGVFPERERRILYGYFWVILKKIQSIRNAGCEIRD